MAVQKYEIKMAGRVLMVGSEKGESQVMWIAEYVENRMQTIANKVRTPDTARIALMTALSGLSQKILSESENAGMLCSRGRRADAKPTQSHHIDQSATRGIRTVCGPGQ